MIKFSFISNAHLGYWCTSGVCRCTDSPSFYCHVRPNKICENDASRYFFKNKKNIYRRVTGPCVTVPAKYYHDHNRCHYEEERCAAHHWPDQQWQSILDLLRVFLCGREVSKPSAVAANKNTPVADYRVKYVILFLQRVASVERLDAELSVQPLPFLESCWDEMNWIFLMK